MKYPEGSLKNQIEFLVSIATRAPSTHNSQPWKFSIEDNVLSVFVDDSIEMPESDPEKQYLYISLGYLLQHLITVGNCYKMLESYEITPNDSKVATFSFKDYAGETDNYCLPMLGAIGKRQNLRGPFKNESVDENLLQKIKDSLTKEEFGKNISLNIIKGDGVSKIGELTAESMKRVYSRPEFRAEMSNWIKPNNSKEKHGIHGYSLNQKLIGSMLLPHIIRLFNIGGKLAKLNYMAIASAPVGFIFSSKDNNKQSWIETGMCSSFLTLSLLVEGLNTSVFVASLEHEDTKKDLQKVANTTEVPQFVTVAGEILVSAPRTPRYSVTEKSI